MDKHRLELFSDGVFVIVLTLLVLDLKPPADPSGLSGFLAIVPALLVHAFTFFVIGVGWLAHHNTLARVRHVTQKTLLINLFALFWVTLIPFAARIAAEHPMVPLGIALFTACRALFSLSTLLMRQSVHSTLDDDPIFEPFLKRRLRLWILLIAVQVATVPLCWISAWFGYVVIIACAVVALTIQTPAEAQAEPQQTDASNRAA